MMSIDSLQTQQTQTHPAKIVAGRPVGNAETPSQGLGFLGLLLAQVSKNSEESGAAGDKKPGETLLQSKNPALSKDPKLDIAQLLAANPDIEKEVKAFSLDKQNALAETLALNQKAFDDALKPTGLSITTAGNAQKGAPGLLSSLLIDSKGSSGDSLSKLNQLLNKLKDLSESENGALVVTNLTPEQLTALQNKIEQLLSQSQKTADTGKGSNAGDPKNEISTELAGLLGGLVKLLPPQGQQDGARGAQALPTSSETSGHLPENFSARLNALFSKVGQFSPHTPEGLALGDTAGGSGTTFEQMMQKLSGKAGAQGLLQNNAALAKNMPQATLPDLSTLQGWPFSLNGSLLSSANFDESMIEKFGLQNPGLNIGTPGSLTNLVTQTYSATLPHPATQMVAATLQKSASSGESKAITLQLDPPDMGRVEVRMDFGKDKILKASIIAEKAETHMMLQRDAHILERALQDAGLSADGSSLSFELAQHDHPFGQENRQGGGHNSGSNGEVIADNDDTLIQSTMTWHVDPKTGQMRFDMLA